MSLIDPVNFARRRVQWAATGAAPMLVLLAACGSSEGAPVASISNSAAPSASSSADSSTQQLAFAKCMRENGIDIPDPDPDGRFSRPM